MEVNYQIADIKALFQILLHPLLFLKMRNKIQGIRFYSISPVNILLYTTKGSIEKLSFKPGNDVHAWRIWKDGSHHIGMCVGLPLVRETLIHNILHEIGHIICHEIQHKSHTILPEKIKSFSYLLENGKNIYRQKLNNFFKLFPKFRKFENMCEDIIILNHLKELYANDVINRYDKSEERLEHFLSEALDICQKHIFYIKRIPIFFINPFMIERTVLISAISESSAIRLSKYGDYKEDQLEHFQEKLDHIYKKYPNEAWILRKNVVSFLTTLSEYPSSSEIIEYLQKLQNHVLTFYDTYKWWLKKMDACDGV